MGKRTNYRLKNPRVVTQYLYVKGQDVPVLIHYESRKYSRVSIGKKGVSIRLPRFLTDKERTKHIDSFKTWATEKILERPDLIPNPLKKKYRTGQMIKVRNREFMLDITYYETDFCRGVLKGSIIYLSLARNMDPVERNKVIVYLISKCLAQKYYDFIYDRLQYWNKKYFKKKINRLTLKYTQTVWGSCSRQGNINISTRLLLAPLSVIDYILVHELAHLYHADHSHRFWNLVGSIMPNYKHKDRWLKVNNDTCDF